jgi:hypothetical protein
MEDLYVIHAYAARKLMPNYNPPFPVDIEAHPWIDKPYAFLPWELETLAREVIVCAGKNNYPRYSFKEQRDLSRGVDHLKHIENAISTKFVNPSNIRQEISVRLAHRQFKYQADSPNTDSLVRYARIFNSPDVAAIIKNKIGLTPTQIATIGGALFGNTLTYFQTLYNPTEFSLPDVTWEDYELFVNKFGITLDDLKAKLLDNNERKLDDTFLYAYHSLINWPLIKGTNSDGLEFVSSPLPVLLYWRISSGLYYDVYDERGFDNAFGKAFENFVGDVSMAIIANAQIVVYPEEENYAGSPHRIDWVVDQNTCGLLVECKTKRLTLGAKVTLLNADELFEQLQILGDAVCQSYESYIAYKEGQYHSPNYLFNSSKKYYLAITTLERWYLMGEQIEMLDEIVLQKLIDKNIDFSLMTEVPYIVAPITDFEYLIHFAKTHSFEDIIQPYIDGVSSEGWELVSYFNENFRSEIENYEFPFSSEYETIYGEEVGTRLRDGEG